MPSRRWTNKTNYCVNKKPEYNTIIYQSFTAELPSWMISVIYEFRKLEPLIIILVIYNITCTIILQMYLLFACPVFINITIFLFHLRPSNKLSSLSHFVVAVVSFIVIIVIFYLRCLPPCFH